MKNYFIATLFILVLFSGCKQDFDLTADYKETPIVYGLLNAQESVHYIRIQKGFLIDANAYTATGIADSIYYKDLTVKLVPYLNGNQSGAIINLFPVSVPKDSGTFASDSNIVYATANNTWLAQDRTYKLEVTNNTNGNTFTTAGLEGIKLVKDFTIAVPANKGFKMALKTALPAKIVWYSAANGALYDVKVRFPYREYDANTNALLKQDFVEVFMTKSLSYEGDAGSNITVDFNGTLLLSTLKNALPANPNIYRTFDVDKGMTFFFAVGGYDLARYISSQNAQGSGLSTNEALPPYTNINGGYGILSSRYFKQMDSVLLTNDALDTLACHPLTNGLNFRKFNGQLCQ